MKPTRTRSDLIDAVMAEMERVWGEEGFGGEWEAYDWLLVHYGITEEEDVWWQFILQYDTDDLPAIDRTKEVLAFLKSDKKVVPFLRSLLEKYRSANDSYPR